MAGLKERLLPPKPASAVNLRDVVYRPSASGRQPFQGVDVSSLKKRGQGLRSWIRVDASGNSQVIEVDKFTLMRRCDLPARDLRLLDPLFVYPSTILGREKAIVVNLEQIRCIITADEVWLLNSLDNYVLQYVVELQRRLQASGAAEVWQSDGAELSRRRGSRNFDTIFGNTSPDYLPFEFRALEVALEAACTFLDSQDRLKHTFQFLWLVHAEMFLACALFSDVRDSSIRYFYTTCIMRWLILPDSEISFVFSIFLLYTCIQLMDSDVLEDIRRDGLALCSLEMEIVRTR